MNNETEEDDFELEEDALEEEWEDDADLDMGDEQVPQKKKSSGTWFIILLVLFGAGAYYALFMMPGSKNHLAKVTGMVQQVMPQEQVSESTLPQPMAQSPVENSIGAEMPIMGMAQNTIEMGVSVEGSLGTETDELSNLFEEPMGMDEISEFPPQSETIEEIPFSIPSQEILQQEEIAITVESDEAQGLDQMLLIDQEEPVITSVPSIEPSKIEDAKVALLEEKNASLENKIISLEKKIADLESELSKKDVKQIIVNKEPMVAPVIAKQTTVYKKKALPVWILKSAKQGQAWVAEKGSREIKSIIVGDNLTGIGKVIKIHKDVNNKWVVKGNKGVVSQ